MDEYRLGVFLYKKMELRYWLVHGNVKNNRINRLNEKCSLTPKGSWLRVPIWKENFCSKALRLFLLPQCTRGRSQVWDLLLRIIGEIKVSRDRFTCVFVASLYVTKVISKSTSSALPVVSFAAVFWDVTQCSSQRNGCSQPNHIPLPILANHSFGFIFKNQFAPNSPFETYRAQSENVFYLCVPSSETSQISMWITGLCLRTPKNTEDAWMSFVCSWRLFKVQANCYRLSTRKIIVKKEYIYFNLPNKGTERSSSFTWFVDSEFWMPLLFSICRKLSDWRLQLDISRKSDILSRAEHTAMSTWSLCTWGFHSHFFPSVMIVAREHSPVLVACVWRETKARSFFAQNLTSFALCYYVIGLFNRVQTNRKHKRKRMWLGCEQFLWGEHCVTSQKTAAEETKVWYAAKTWRREGKFFVLTFASIDRMTVSLKRSM